MTAENLPRRNRSHGDGTFRIEDFQACGADPVFEAGVLVFHPETIRLGENVYVGHQTILKGYHKNAMVIGDGTWIGQQCFFHSAGGLVIGKKVGIGPGVRIITSVHDEAPRGVHVPDAPLRFAAVEIGDGADLGVGSIILPGVRVGKGAIVGAGSVVTRDVPDHAVVAGSPARVLRHRD